MASNRRKDGLTVLKADHREVEKLFKRYQGLTERAVKTKNTIIAKVCDELELHDQIERAHLYPLAQRQAEGTEGLVEHALEEHTEVSEMLQKLRGMDATEPETDQLMRRLIESVTDHVQEEEKELFPKLETELERETLLELGSAIMEMKREAKRNRRAA